jgi:glycosyltransferase involved in cell wall biosynthesis
MSRSLPRIAVLIPAYNAEKIISRALASLAANAEPHDIIVVDDGSKIPLADCLPAQPNLIILRAAKNLGVTGAMNFGLHYILDKEYEFVARLDADDTASPDRLALQRAFMDGHPDVALAGGWGRIVSEQGETLFHLHHPAEHKDIVRKSYYNTCFLHPTLMMRTSALRSFGVYNEKYPSAEDYELTRRFAQHQKVANLPRYLVNYTMSNKGISLSKRRQLLTTRLKIQWDYRNFRSLHFYLGLSKTLVLWFMPVSLITAIKQRKKEYRDRNAGSAHV